MKMNRFSADMRYMSALVIICGIIVCFVLNVNSSTFVMPQYGYASDTIFAQMPLKMMQEGSFTETSRLSTPFIFSFSEFPGDKLPAFFMIFLSKIFSLNIWGALHLYYLLTYLLTAVIAYIVAREFDLAPSWSFITAMAYTFMPYHFHRGVYHLGLASYYLVPLSFLVFSWVYHGEKFKWRYLGGSILYLILLALNGTYYFFFASLILGALLMRAIRIKDKKFAVVILTILIISSAAFLAIYKYPTDYQIENGVNDLLIERPPIGAQVYGLRLAAMITHSILYLLPQNETGAATYIGIFGALGMLCVLFSRKCKDSFNEMLRFIFIICFLFCTVDGLGLIFSHLTGGLVRGLSRVVVYLAFIAFLAAAKELDEYTKNKANKILCLCVFTCVSAVVFLDFFDYRTFLHRPAFNNPIVSEYESDQEFFKEMESNLPVGAKVYQLPYMPFPEVPPIYNMTDYEHFKAFLHTETLRFSYGANKGRQADYWNKYINSLPPEDMVKELENNGFGAVYLDTAGYEDNGIAITEKLESIIGRAPTYSPDRRRLFFVLSPSGTQQDAQYPEYQLSDVIPLYAGKTNYKYLALNWNWNAENDGIWSAGKDVRLRFDVGIISSDIALRLEKTDIDIHPDDKISVTANGQNVAVWGQKELADAILTAPVNRDIVNQNDGKLEIKFTIDSSRFLNLTNESGRVYRGRKVRIRIKNLVLDPIDFNSAAGNDFLIFPDFPPVNEEGISFGSGGNDSHFLATGFSGPEEGYRWTEGKQAVLAFTMNKDSADMTAIFEISPLLGGNFNAQRAEVFVNDVKTADWSINQLEEKELLLTKSMSEDGKFIIKFKLPDAVSPKELGMSDDTRKLALQFRSIRFVRNQNIEKGQ